MKLELVKGEKEFYLRLKYNNGRIFMHSEGYHSRSNAIRAAKSFIRQASNILRLHRCVIS